MASHSSMVTQDLSEAGCRGASSSTSLSRQEARQRSAHLQGLHPADPSARAPPSETLVSETLPHQQGPTRRRQPVDEEEGIAPCGYHEQAYGPGENETTEEDQAAEKWAALEAVGVGADLSSSYATDSGTDHSVSPHVQMQQGQWDEEPPGLHDQWDDKGFSDQWDEEAPPGEWEEDWLEEAADNEWDRPPPEHGHEHHHALSESDPDREDPDAEPVWPAQNPDAGQVRQVPQAQQAPPQVDHGVYVVSDSGSEAVATAGQKRSAVYVLSDSGSEAVFPARPIRSDRVPEAASRSYRIPEAASRSDRVSGAASRSDRIPQAASPARPVRSDHFDRSRQASGCLIIYAPTRDAVEQIAKVHSLTPHHLRAHS